MTEPISPRRWTLDGRAAFLNAAGLLQGGIVVLALLLAALANQQPLQDIQWNPRDVAWGLAAIVPMLVVFAMATKIRSLVVDLMGRPLSDCTWYDLVLLAVVAGFGEELLFRGVLQPWLGRIHPAAGWIGTNLLFGLVHGVTPLYAVLAALFGVYLSWLGYGLAETNLARPIITHAAYDYIAFLLIVREFRRRNRDSGARAEPPREGEAPAEPPP